MTPYPGLLSRLALLIIIKCWVHYHYSLLTRNTNTLVSEKLLWIQKKKSSETSRPRWIFNLWDEFNSGSHKACSYLNGPVSGYYYNYVDWSSWILANLLSKKQQILRHIKEEKLNFSRVYFCIETTSVCIESTCIETTLYRNDRELEWELATVMRFESWRFEC